MPVAVSPGEMRVFGRVLFSPLLQDFLCLLEAFWRYDGPFRAVMVVMLFLRQSLRRSFQKVHNGVAVIDVMSAVNWVLQYSPYVPLVPIVTILGFHLLFAKCDGDKAASKSLVDVEMIDFSDDLRFPLVDFHSEVINPVISENSRRYSSFL